jgi:enoyl-CoA hydratase
MPEPVVITEVVNRTLVVTLNRPDAMNAINAELAEGVLAAVERLDGDPDLSVGVLAGAGRGFCAGMDLKAFVAGSGGGRITEFFRDGASKPLIAAVEGFALAGGLELALTCDLIVSAATAKFGIPEVKVGLFAAGGALLRLQRALPEAVAMELALTGDPITAETAHAHGLVCRLADPGGALAVALELADRIGARAPLAIVASKRALRGAKGRTEAEFWEFQRPLLEEVFASADAKEGARAFAEKRPAVWTGS